MDALNQTNFPYFDPDGKISLISGVDRGIGQAK
jgi:hypothetical protein